jgi:hypothetical protein
LPSSPTTATIEPDTIALEFHFEGMSEDSCAIPKPRGVASYRQVMKDLDVDHYFLAHVQVDTNRFAGPAVPTTTRS